MSLQSDTLSTPFLTPESTVYLTPYLSEDEEYEPLDRTNVLIDICPNFEEKIDEFTMALEGNAMDDEQYADFAWQVRRQRVAQELRNREDEIWRAQNAAQEDDVVVPNRMEHWGSSVAPRDNTQGAIPKIVVSDDTQEKGAVGGALNPRRSEEEIDQDERRADELLDQDLFGIGPPFNLEENSEDEFYGPGDPYPNPLDVPDDAPADVPMDVPEQPNPTRRMQVQTPPPVPVRRPVVPVRTPIVPPARPVRTPVFPVRTPRLPPGRMPGQRFRAQSQIPQPVEPNYITEPNHVVEELPIKVETHRSSEDVENAMFH
jgi:hypothetical protein